MVAKIPIAQTNYFISIDISTVKFLNSTVGYGWEDKMILPSPSGGIYLKKGKKTQVPLAPIIGKKFLPPTAEAPMLWYKDGNPLNLTLENLCRVSRKDMQSILAKNKVTPEPGIKAKNQGDLKIEYECYGRKRRLAATSMLEAKAVLSLIKNEFNVTL